MRRFAWLFALPYVVVTSPGQQMGTIKTAECWAIHYKESRIAVDLCDTKEVCEDKAFLLNEAHERRHPKKIDPVFKSSNFDYKSACGQDDCGVDPK